MKTRCVPRGRIRSAQAAAPLSLILIFAASGALRVAAAPVASAGFELSPLAAFSRLPELAWGFQPGFELAVSGLIDIPFGSNGARDTRFALSPSLGIIMNAFWLGQSAPAADGNLYRAWRGYGLGFLGGISAGPIGLPLISRPAHLRLLGGSGFRAAKFTGTGIVAAHAGYFARLGLDIDLDEHTGLTISLPVEFASLSGGQSIVAGLSVGFRKR